MNDLIYTYSFSTDREISLTVKREKGQLPKFISSYFDFETLTDQEFEEFNSWQVKLVDTLMEEFTPEEVLQIAKYGVNIVFG